MIYEGVNFFEPAVKQMKKKDFIRLHKDAFWLNRDEGCRKEMLSSVYDAIKSGKSPKPKGEGQ